MTSFEIVPGLYRVELGISNAYLVGGVHGIVLVDTGPVGSLPAIERALDSLGLGASDLELIVLTHAHDDHAGSAAELSKWSGAPVACGGEDLAVAEGAPAPKPVLTPAERELHAVVTAGGLPPTPPCLVSRALDDGDLVGTATQLQVIATPGHTPGSIAVFAPGLGALLTGDTIAEHRGAAVLGPFNVDRELAWTSLTRLASLSVDIAGFGHGQSVARGAQAFIRSATDPFGEA